MYQDPNLPPWTTQEELDSRDEDIEETDSWDMDDDSDDTQEQIDEALYYRDLIWY